MRRMGEGALGQTRRFVRPPPSVRRSACHLSVPGRIWPAYSVPRYSRKARNSDEVIIVITSSAKVRTAALTRPSR